MMSKGTDMSHDKTIGCLALTGMLFMGSSVIAQPRKTVSSRSPSGSLLVENAPRSTSTDIREREAPHELRDTSMFAVKPPEPRTFMKHDLVQIIVRESSRAKSTHDLETEKEYTLEGAITAFPRLSLSDLLDFQVEAGRTTGLPRVGVDFSNEFTGEGEYQRRDDLTARLTAEIIEILPNGNLILEARTFIKNDEEEMSIKVTGICRPDDISFANTILSNQIHDLHIEKMHEGELKKASEKGIIARVLDAIFAF